MKGQWATHWLRYGERGRGLFNAAAKGCVSSGANGRISFRVRPVSSPPVNGAAPILTHLKIWYSSTKIWSVDLQDFADCPL